MEEANFFVGQEFPDVKTFRSAIKEAAIAQHFELRIIKSDLIRYIAKCAAEGCPWRIRAIKLPNASTFSIRSLEGTHTCGRNASSGHHQASVDWIVNFIEERLRGNVNYRPKDILHDIYEQYGITIPYKQAWRAKERGLQAIHGSSEEGYYLLPAYCDQIRKTNPGSVAEVFTTGTDNRFHRLFLSFYASMHGFFHGCLPVIGLGGIQLKSKYLGTLLSATSFDSNGGLFPLAFGIVDVENDESWMWFLSELHKALEMASETILRLTFLSNGGKGITDAVIRKFPTAWHGVCLKHLSKSISREFKNPLLVQLLWKAAYATTTISFKEKMAELEKASADAAKWLQQYPPARWALMYFEGPRYGHLSSNIDEFNQWILEARELPIMQVIEQIHSKLMAEFEDRREKCKSWFFTLVPSAEKHMIEATDRASTYQVLQSDEAEFEILSSERSDIVNIKTHSCSCRDWKLYSLPCSHAVAAITASKRDVHTFIGKYFTVASYRTAYAKEVRPVPRRIEWNKDEQMDLNNELQIVRPPKSRRPPGRPEKKRMCVEDLNREKHIVHCSQCNQIGHYKSTCKSGTWNSIEHM
ncbi:uncharacterized protein LOC127262622 [Andrographis paniculata]|uniref:uncharacterized protein LOC127262622 n=1 Tax=Andrographis paniculata TaxID=175694 RepID=UPI0021E75ECF|nr:uncharacterized protein LOC127262622 [Andrographis paniculata]XP_051147352.1 uncharacterized protein LOC127262622 [Andrographis paniculata]